MLRASPLSALGQLAARAFTLIEDLAAWLSAAMLSLVTLAISLDVLGRRLLGAGLEWATEASELSLLYITFLAAPWVLRHAAHVRQEFLIQRVPPSPRRVTEIATSGLCLVVFALLAVFAGGVALDLQHRHVFVGAIWRIPKSAFAAAAAVGFLLLGLELFRHIILLLRPRGAER